ncbi:MAG: UbiA family prenyltransferase [Limnobacter sp.]|nr:UbiA family prenyltransferase [Limnobacter sp.]
MKTIVYVDLDGSLTSSDVLLESCLQLARLNVLFVFRMLWWALQGAWVFKQKVAEHIDPDLSDLPLNQKVLERLNQYRHEGYELVLASASVHRDASKVAQRVGVFDRVIGSTTSNLKGERKLEAIVEDAQGLPFVYVGNEAADLPVWARSQHAIAVNPGKRVCQRAQKEGIVLDVIDTHSVGAGLLSKAMRIQQWAKNCLLFLPLLASHSVNPAEWGLVCLAFLAFGLVASATYLWNDMLDLPADRRHPRKRHRALASGQLSIVQGIVFMKALGIAGFAFAWVAGGWPFVAVLALYTAATLFYSFALKRVAFVDVLVLSLLYTLRVVAGAVAAGLDVSNWLLALSLFYVSQPGLGQALCRAGVFAVGRGAIPFRARLSPV